MFYNELGDKMNSVNIPAFFYVTDNPEFIPLIRKSIHSLDEHMPEFLRVVFVPGNRMGDLDIQAKVVEFNEKLLWSPRWYFNFVKLMPSFLETLRSVYHVTHAIYLDCDTYLCSPVDELFWMLLKFDMMGAHSPRRYTPDTRKFMPDAFPEWNMGVNPMRVSDAVINFWRCVTGIYAEYFEEFGNDDQKPLRLALWEYAGNPGFNVHTLSPEYNFRFNFPCFAADQVKILHGKSDDIKRIAQIANEREGFRAWTSGISLD